MANAARELGKGKEERESRSGCPPCCSAAQLPHASRPRILTNSGLNPSSVGAQTRCSSRLGSAARFRHRVELVRDLARFRHRVDLVRDLARFVPCVAVLGKSL